MPNSIGEQLAAARVAQELEIEDVAHGTHIHHDVLRQLEANEFDKMPNEMFAKSFLRLYGEHVGVDTDTAIAKLDLETASHGEQFLLGGINPEVRSRYGNLATRIPVRPIVASAVVVLALLIGGGYLVSHLYGAEPEIGAEVVPSPNPDVELAVIPEPKPEPAVKTTMPVSTEPASPVPTDTDEILKGEPVVRKAEPVDEDDLSTEDEPSDDGSTTTEKPFIVEGFAQDGASEGE